MSDTSGSSHLDLEKLHLLLESTNLGLLVRSPRRFGVEAESDGVAIAFRGSDVGHGTDVRAMTAGV